MPVPKSWFSLKVEVRESAIHGKGLHARTAIAAGEVVVVKGGHVFPTTVRDAVEQKLGPTEIQIWDDLFLGPVRPEEREASMMYLNHSCDPNVGLQGQIVFVALRDIAADDELTTDYAMMDDEDWTMACACGARLCRGTVTGRDWRLPELQQRYRGFFSTYLARKIAAL